MTNESLNVSLTKFENFCSLYQQIDGFNNISKEERENFVVKLLTEMNTENSGEDYYNKVKYFIDNLYYVFWDDMLRYFSTRVINFSSVKEFCEHYYEIYESDTNSLTFKFKTMFLSSKFLTSNDNYINYSLSDIISEIKQSPKLYDSFVIKPKYKYSYIPQNGYNIGYMDALLNYINMYNTIIEPTSTGNAENPTPTVLDNINEMIKSLTGEASNQFFRNFLNALIIKNSTDFFSKVRSTKYDDIIKFVMDFKKSDFTNTPDIIEDLYKKNMYSNYFIGSNSFVKRFFQEVINIFQTRLFNYVNTLNNNTTIEEYENNIRFCILDIEISSLNELNKDNFKYNLFKTYIKQICIENLGTDKTEDIISNFENDAAGIKTFAGYIEKVKQLIKALFNAIKNQDKSQLFIYPESLIETTTTEENSEGSV